MTTDIAQTIIQQLGGAGKLKTMINAKDFTWDASTQTLTFKFSGSRIANCLKITLDPDDTYSLEFWRIPTMKTMLDGASPVVVKSLDLIYAEQLVEVFEETVKLRLILC